MLLPLLLGQPTGPQAYTLDAEVGTFTLSGQAATLARQLNINAASASFTITGQAATLQYSRNLSASSESFSIAGQSATLLRTFADLNAEASSYTLSGQDVTFDRTFAARELYAEPGTYDILGQSSTFFRDRVFNAEALTEGSYFGEDYADPTYSKAIGIYVNGQTYFSNDYLNPGYVDGAGATLAYHRIFNAESGSYAITGQDANLLKTSTYPDPSDVRLGVAYGPNGIYEGTLTSQSATLKYWDGTQWVVKGMKYWNGSSWQ